MRGLDDTDRQILRILLRDARRSWSAIGDEVGLSGPAVADRVERLRDLGVIERFTVALNRSLLDGGVDVLVEIEARPGRAGAVAESLRTTDAVEHVFETAGERVYATATVPSGDAATLVTDTVDTNDVREYDVRLLAEATWTSGIGEVDLAPTCAECGNTVDREGETVALDGETYHFCCGSCRENFVEAYESIKEGA